MGTAGADAAPRLIPASQAPTEHLGRTATGAVPRLENGWPSRAWGFDSLSFRSRIARPTRRAPRPRKEHAGTLGFTEAWPSWQGSALLARRRRKPLAGSSPAASVARCDVVQSAGRPAVTRWMLVRAQPSQLTRPGLLADRGCRPLKPATRVRIPLGASRWGNPWFPHRPPPPARARIVASLASRPAKPASGHNASCTD